ncbi:MAG: PEP/pyruvate-binding domain-containing protein [Egibacteraceae bacterium]
MSASTIVGAPLVVPLAALTQADLGLGGGKAAGLGELIHQGFRVPPGFCVTTHAWRLAEERAGLQALLAAPPAGDEQLAAAARSALLAVPMPGEVAAVVAAEYERMGAGPVAVRSSATAEDLPTASFAGQQDTELNVVGVDTLLEAVRRCWASLWTDRAVSYRTANGIDHRGVHLAVVVQRMVDATAAGVMFTANPVTGSRKEVVIDASEGLGEAVVSGRVTPDRYVLAKRLLRITERHLGRREVVIRAKWEGGAEEIIGETTGNAVTPAIPGRVLRSLARLGIAIERAAGVPSDVEWAWADGQLFILQSRPITALPHPVRDNRFSRFRAGLNSELLPIRPYPLDLGFLHVLGQRILPEMFRQFGVRVDPIERALDLDDGVALRMRLWGPRPTLRTLALPWVLWRTRRVQVAGWQDDELLAEARRRARALEARDLSALGWAEVLATADEAMEVPLLIARVRGRYLGLAMRDLARFYLFVTLVGQRRHAPALLSGIRTKTVEINEALEELAAMVRRSPPLSEAFASSGGGLPLLSRLGAEPQAAEFLTCFRSMLNEYGHRENLMALASQPTWKQAPEIPLGIIAALASGDPEGSVDGPALWEANRDRLVSESILGQAWLRKLFLADLERARRFYKLREDTHFYLGLGHPAMRGAWLELGRRLAGAGVIDAPEDVLHFTQEELARAETAWPPPPGTRDQLRSVAARRKARRAALGERLPLAAQFPAKQPAAAGALITGVPASPGTAEGAVRVITEPVYFAALQPGEILVAPLTNPAWTPLFLRAAAVVVESGGAFSHAAIVAREYGIPAVMSATGATTRLQDGQRVRVDGTAGAVYRA